MKGHTFSSRPEPLTFAIRGSHGKSHVLWIIPIESDLLSSVCHECSSRNKYCCTEWTFQNLHNNLFRIFCHIVSQLVIDQSLKYCSNIAFLFVGSLFLQHKFILPDFRQSGNEPLVIGSLMELFRFSQVNLDCIKILIAIFPPEALLFGIFQFYLRHQ